MSLKFTNSETSLDYIALTREYITQHGKPTVFYSDKHAVFKVNSRDAKTAKITQFGRALKDLNIEFMDDFNRRFTKPPTCTKDMYRPIHEEEYDELDDIKERLYDHG